MEAGEGASALLPPHCRHALSREARTQGVRGGRSISWKDRCHLLQEQPNGKGCTWPSSRGTSPCCTGFAGGGGLCSGAAATRTSHLPLPCSRRPQASLIMLTPVHNHWVPGLGSPWKGLLLAPLQGPLAWLFTVLSTHLPPPQPQGCRPRAFACQGGPLMCPVSPPGPPHVL